MSQPFLHIPTLTPETASKEGGDLLTPVIAKLGFQPNMYGAMVNVPSLLKTYLQGYADFRAHGGFTPVEQEVIFITISKTFGCDYCTAAHSFVGEKMSGVPAEILAALRAGSVLPNENLQALSAFTRAMVETSGRPDADVIAAYRAAGYSDEQALGVILAIGVKVFSNFTNRAGGTELDEVFQHQAVA